MRRENTPQNPHNKLFPGKEKKHEKHTKHPNQHMWVLITVQLWYTAQH